MSRSISLRRLIGPAVMRPSLWPDLVRAAWRFRRRDWYRRFPFMPLPSPRYLEWRMHTAYGDEGGGPDPAELRRYLAWARRMKQTRPLA